MKAVDILKKADQIEDIIIVIKEPTKNVNGVAVRLCNDPQIEIFDIENGKGNDYYFKVGKKKYRKCSRWFEHSYTVDVEIAEKLAEAFKKLINLEVK